MGSDRVRRLATRSPPSERVYLLVGGKCLLVLVLEDLGEVTCVHMRWRDSDGTWRTR